jgi:cardiolipin synthase
MGGGFGSIASAMHELFALATDEIVLTAYTVSIGARSFFHELEILLERGINIRILMNRYDTQPEEVRRRLENLHTRFPMQLQLFSFVPLREEGDLHAKVMIIDRLYALVGASNLLQREFLDNYELALVLEGSAVADIVRAVDLLLGSPQVVQVPITRA